MHPAPAAVRDLLLRLAMSCMLQDMPESAWAVHLEDFVEDLSDIPIDLIADACRTWRRQCKFFPSIAEFLALAEPEARKRRHTLDRLRILQHVAKNPAPDGKVSLEWYLSLGQDKAPLALPQPALPQPALPRRGEGFTPLAAALCAAGGGSKERRE